MISKYMAKEIIRKLAELPAFMKGEGKKDEGDTVYSDAIVKGVRLKDEKKYDEALVVFQDAYNKVTDEQEKNTLKEQIDQTNQLKTIKPQSNDKTPASPPAGASAAPQATGTYAPYVNPSRFISMMQQELQELSETVLTDYRSESIVKKDYRSKQVEESDPRIKSRKSFSDFFTEHYLGGVKGDKGTEYSTDPYKTNRQTKDPTKTGLYELNVVMDGFARIGPGSREKDRDGIWGFRTNNALNNCLKFGKALLSIEGDLGVPTRQGNITSDELKRYENIMSQIQEEKGTNSEEIYYSEVAGEKKEGNPVSSNDKFNYSKELVKYIAKIQNTYESFRDEVIGSPKFSDVIEGMKGRQLMSFKPGEKSSPNKITDQDKYNISEKGPLSSAVIQSIPYTVFIPYKGKQNKYMNLPIQALLSKDNYIAFIKQLHPNILWDEAYKIFANYIKPYVEKMESLMPKEIQMEVTPAPSNVYKKWE